MAADAALAGFLAMCKRLFNKPMVRSLSRRRYSLTSKPIESHPDVCLRVTVNASQCAHENFAREQRSPSVLEDGRIGGHGRRAGKDLGSARPRGGAGNAALHWHCAALSRPASARLSIGFTARTG